MKGRDWLHRILDGDADQPRPSPDSPEAERLAEYEGILDDLAGLEIDVPPDLEARVLAALPGEPDPSWGERLRALWPRGARWVAPALAGALAALVVAVGVPWPTVSPEEDRVAVTFEVHAPGARNVALVGSFTGWRPGEIALDGPDATGHWTATVRLPSGRHEYLFLVDGHEWVSDPRATLHRPDGFGRTNALIEL